MKLTQIAILAFTFSVGYTVNAQERTKSAEPIKKISLTELNLTPEQIAKNKAEELKTKVNLTDEQFASVENLFLKMEQKRGGIANLNEEEKSNAKKELQLIEDRELNSILTPAQQKLNSDTKSTTKTATSM